MAREDGTEDIVDQVRSALENLDIGTGETRQALLDGVRDALGRVREGVDDMVSSVVVERREAGDGRPDLRVVDPDTAEADDEADDEPDVEDAIRRAVHVQWLGADRHGGTIAIPDPGTDDAAAWQTVFHGPEPRSYRLSCERGLLEVAADGASIARMQADQTIDLVAASIRVRAVDGGAYGSYLRLPGA